MPMPVSLTEIKTFRCRIPVVIDGFISIVAALCAQRLCGTCRDFMFPSHISEEAGYLQAARALNLEPWLNLHLRLGEGSGCVLAFQILEAACALMRDMATFEEAGIDDGYLTEIREQEEQDRKAMQKTGNDQRNREKRR